MPELTASRPTWRRTNKTSRSCSKEHDEIHPAVAEQGPGDDAARVEGVCEERQGRQGEDAAFLEAHAPGFCRPLLRRLEADPRREQAQQACNLPGRPTNAERAATASAEFLALHDCCRQEGATHRRSHQQANDEQERKQRGGVVG